MRAAGAQRATGGTPSYCSSLNVSHISLSFPNASPSVSSGGACSAGDGAVSAAPLDASSSGAGGGELESSITSSSGGARRRRLCRRVDMTKRKEREEEEDRVL